MNKQQGGFTLIELVIVIIILGILSVFAAPKFIDLQGDARVATLSGAKAAIMDANALVYSKASIAGSHKKGGSELTDAATVLITDTLTVKTQFGYLEASSANLIRALDVDSSTQWTFSGTNPVKVQLKNSPETCFFTYTQSTAKEKLPVFSKMPVAKDC